MASLLDGIDFDNGRNQPQRSGPSATILKIGAAAAMLLLAGAFFAMQAGIIPWPFSATQGPQVAQHDTQQSQEEVRQINQKLQQQVDEFIAGGGQIGTS